MSFLSKIFPVLKIFEESCCDNDDEKKSPSISNYSEDFEALDFEDEHNDDIEQWNIKIDNAECSESDNPDKQIEAYENAILLCDEFKEYCYSFGHGGSSYYDDNEEYRKEELEESLQEYLDYEYEEEKQYYDEQIAKKKLFVSTKKKILKYVSLNNGVMRKDIYAQFDSELKPLVLKALNYLTNENKVLKTKQGKKLIFKTISK